MIIENQITSKVGVYLIHFCTGKVYVGSSTNLKKRLLDHLSRLGKGKSNCIALQRAYTKYGLGAMRFRVLEYCFVSDVRSLEMDYILKYKSTEDGYNIALDTSLPMLGRKHTEATKKLMSEKAKGNKGRTGQTLTLEHRAKLRVSLKGVGLGIPVNVGEANSGCKLTAKEAREILDLKGVVSQVFIATLYNISSTQVGKIHRGIKWKSIRTKKDE